MAVVFFNTPMQSFAAVFLPNVRDSLSNLCRQQRYLQFKLPRVILFRKDCPLSFPDSITGKFKAAILFVLTMFLPQLASGKVDKIGLLLFSLC